MSKTGIQYVEFDPAKHETLRELFDTTHQDIWKVLFKVAEVPPSLTEDRGASKAPRQSGKFLYLSGYLFALV